MQFLRVNLRCNGETQTNGYLYEIEFDEVASAINDDDKLQMGQLYFGATATLIRFGGRQVHASEDDGSVNHALVRDLNTEAKQLDQFSAELDAD